jgi:type III secretion protein V
MPTVPFAPAVPAAWLRALRAGAWSDLALAAAMVAVVALMILPLPTTLVDACLALSISTGIGLVLAALCVPSPAAFSSFPSAILITTLFRLALAVATTRLILLHGDAGQVIDAFGKLVVGGNLVVGLVVFLIVTVVQFIVIAKGAERVAEVAARFTLDALPGKQLSIDSDLRAGLIDKDEARRRRRALETESQLHGSLDGAMKFVKGDAIAGIVVILVNLLGGLAVGVLQRGMSLAEAARVYSILTIGEGLVMQIPALLAAMAAGLFVTRTAGDADARHLGESIGRQLAGEPRVLVLTGAIAMAIAWVPGFPAVVFLALGLVLVLAGLAAGGRLAPLKARLFPPRAADALAADWPTPPAGAADAHRLAAPLALELGAAARGELAPARLERECDRARAALYEALGVVAPALEARRADGLADERYRILVFEVPAADGVVRPGHRFVHARGVPREALPAALEPGERFLPDADTYWAPAEALPALPELPVRTFDAAQLIGHHLAAVLRRHAAQFLGIQETSALTGRLAQTDPELVKETLRAVPLPRLADVLRRLVEEGVSIRSLREICEALADAGQREKDPQVLAELVRVRLRRYLSHLHAGAARTLEAYLLAPELEERIRQSVRPNGQLALEPELALRVLEQLRARRGGAGRAPVVLTAIDLRRPVRQLVEAEFHDLAVLSYQELAADLRIQPVGRLAA